MAGRRDDLVDAAIRVLGTRGVRGLTHRAVDAEADVPAGSTSNPFRTRDALIVAVMQRIVDRERAAWDAMSATAFPTTPTEFARALATFAQAATGPHRTLTLARYAILVESGIQPGLREPVAAGGARARAWFMHSLKAAGSTDPQQHGPILMNHWTGVVLHQLARPVDDFDPLPQIAALTTALLRSYAPEVPT